MDTPQTFTAWAAIGAGALAPIGAAFGGIAGAVARAQGYAPGCALGQRIARKLAQISEKPFSPGVEGFIIGSVDGAVFLGSVGVLVGLLAGYGGSTPSPTFLLITAGGLAVLAVAALVLGGIALGLVRAGMMGVVLFSFAGVGTLLGLCLGGGRAAMWGLLAGTTLGLVGALLHRQS